MKIFGIFSKNTEHFAIIFLKLPPFLPYRFSENFQYLFRDLAFWVENRGQEILTVVLWICPSFWSSQHSKDFLPETFFVKMRRSLFMAWNVIPFLWLGLLGQDWGWEIKFSPEFIMYKKFTGVDPGGPSLTGFSPGSRSNKKVTGAHAWLTPVMKNSPGSTAVHQGSFSPGHWDRGVINLIIKTIV